MGAVLAKFRKEKTTTEVLEKLEQDIKEIEEYSISTQARQKRYVGNFLVISIGFYVICFIVFYFAFFPPTWMERISYSVPLLIFPLIIFLLKRLVAWYFQRKLNKNTTKLNKLKSEKKKVLEKVMDKETYKVAIEILNRFGDKTTTPKLSGAITPYISNTPVRHSPVASVPKQQHLLAVYPSQQSQNLINRSPASLRKGDIDFTNPLTPLKSQSNLSTPNTPDTSVHSLQIQRKRTPYPIINQNNKGVVEKMVDYLIGDGPQFRFAMICKACYGHNGMALQEEYEYAAFRCVYCNAMNPSRKSRPIAPKLPMATATHTTLLPIEIIRKNSDSSTSTSEKYSGSDSDDSENLQNKKTLINESIGKNSEHENISSTINTITDDIADTNIAGTNITDILNNEELELENPEKLIDEKKND